MATAAELITSARFDLRDENKTQYSDAMLLDFLNRGLRPLSAALSALKSDWVNTSTTLTLALAGNSVALPTLFISSINAKIDTKNLIKESVSKVRDMRVTSTAGEPNYYAIQGTSMLFERVADAEYSILFEYHTATAALASTEDMPYNDEFNDVVRTFIILLGKNRNEYSAMADAAIQDFFYDALLSKLVARNHIPSQIRLDF